MTYEAEVGLAVFRMFLAERVDVAIVEVGLGGRLDATNCVRQPVVCGVAALGFDHMNLLGHTLPVRGSPHRRGVWICSCSVHAPLRCSF